MTAIASLIAFFVLLLVFRSTIKVATNALPSVANDLLGSAVKASKQLNHEIGTLASEARVEQRQRLTNANAAFKQLMAEDSRSDEEILREMGF